MILKKTVFFCFFTFVLSFSFSETLSSSPLLRGISPSLQPEVKKLLEKEINNYLKSQKIKIKLDETTKIINSLVKKGGRTNARK